MTKWLFDSHGKPIAFLSLNHVFSPGGKFLGNLDGMEVWKGKYIGQIYKEDRLLYKKGKGYSSKGVPPIPATPPTPTPPGNKTALILPSGYEDVKLN